ncbi:MAG: hypothetical protein Q9187_006416 [Circinaria calcarea]
MLSHHCNFGGLDPIVLSPPSQSVHYEKLKTPFDRNLSSNSIVLGPPSQPVHYEKPKTPFDRNPSSNSIVLSPPLQPVHYEKLKTSFDRNLPSNGLCRLRQKLQLRTGFDYSERVAREPIKDADLIPLINKRLGILSERLGDEDFLSSVGLEGMKEKAELQLDEFADKVKRQFLEWKSSQSSREAPPTLESLRRAFNQHGQVGMDAQLKFAFQGHIANSAFTKSDIWNQAYLADLRYPSEWYPATRAFQRTIHLHVGPTNSGKTYHALKRLEQAESGIYAGPLRLLAHEVYSRLNAKGKLCHLITGDERIVTESETSETKMSSCTVEMVPINKEVDVAVVDEIQMIGSRERGWAWTQAVLGLKAKELHLCGEERAVPLIKELTAAIGDKLEIHRYTRLSPLRTMSTSLEGDLTKLRKGDCVVTFSRLGIHALKKAIEQQTGKRVAVVYGSLPPETRAQQAKLFNDPDNDYDILVASDAIGMGLNLSIKRVIFETVYRSDGQNYRVLPVSDIKQIAGRAGRFRTAADDQKEEEKKISIRYTEQKSPRMSTAFPPTQNLGLVTSLDKLDLPIIQRAMQTEAEPITSAGIFPPATILQKFATYFPPETPFSYVMLRLHEISRMHPRFHLCELRDQIGIADVLHPIKDLTVGDRISICAAPANLRDKDTPMMLTAFAKCVANQGGGSILEIPELNLEILDHEMTADKMYLSSLETLHKALVLYLWLSYRFSGIFTTQGLAFHVKTQVEEKIDKVLAGFSFNKNARDNIRRRRELSILRDFGKRYKGGYVTVRPVHLGSATSPSMNGDQESSLLLDGDLAELKQLAAAA